MAWAVVVSGQGQVHEGTSLLVAVASRTMEHLGYPTSQTQGDWPPTSSLWPAHFSLPSPLAPLTVFERAHDEPFRLAF